MNDTLAFSNPSHTLHHDLTSLVTVQPGSIVSRTIYQDERSRAILFSFDAEQELSEHTASRAAIIEILQGEARVGVDDATYELKPGDWLHMAPRLPHSVYAKTPLIMLLTMIGCE